MSRGHPGGAASHPPPFRRAASGAAFVEFTLVFPVLVFLFLGLVEFSQGLAVSRKLSHAATEIADLVARMPTVRQSDLDDIARLAEVLMRPYDPAALALAITSVEADSGNVRRPRWSYARGAGAAPRGPGSPLPLPPGLTEPGSSLVLVEATYHFRPSIGYFITGAIELRSAGYFRPRASRSVVKVD